MPLKTGVMLLRLTEIHYILKYITISNIISVFLSLDEHKRLTPAVLLKLEYVCMRYEISDELWCDTKLSYCFKTLAILQLTCIL